MATLKITLAQKERILEMYNTPLTELSSEQLLENLKTEMGVEMPIAALGDFFQSGFGLNLRARPRKLTAPKEVKPKREPKQKIFTFEIEQEDGSVENVVVDLKKEVVTNVSEVINTTSDESADESAAEIIDQTFSESNLEVTNFSTFINNESTVSEPTTGFNNSTVSEQD